MFGYTIVHKDRLMGLEERIKFLSYSAAQYKDIATAAVEKFSNLVTRYDNLTTEVIELKDKIQELENQLLEIGERNDS